VLIWVAVTGSARSAVVEHFFKKFLQAFFDTPCDTHMVLTRFWLLPRWHLLHCQTFIRRAEDLGEIDRAYAGSIDLASLIYKIIRQFLGTI